MLQTLPASCNHSFQSRHSALQFLLNFQCVSVISTTCAASLGSYIAPSKLYNCPPEDGFAQFHAWKGIPHSGERQRRPTCTHVPHKHEASHDTNVLLERQNSRIQGVDLSSHHTGANLWPSAYPRKGRWEVKFPQKSCNLLYAVR
ncbi:hypothetical protein B0T12DRAFT_231153 [Alternaria alternata]|nr:hypothetical protein B0T12DRAFT_231153 [Alternaria alternata]